MLKDLFDKELQTGDHAETVCLATLENLLAIVYSMLQEVQEIGLIDVVFIR